MNELIDEQEMGLAFVRKQILIFFWNGSIWLPSHVSAIVAPATHEALDPEEGRQRAQATA